MYELSGFQKGHKINVGRKNSPETRRKISVANTGKVFSEEWRRNMSLAQKGRPSWRKGKKFVDEGLSREKTKKYRQKWHKDNAQRIREQARTRYKLNPKKMVNKSQEYYKKHRQEIHDRIRFNKYGITGDEFRKIIEQQGLKCPICTRSIEKNLSVDHDHATGKIRGIICNNCNLSIGNAEDSPMRLRAMADYLEKNQ